MHGDLETARATVKRMTTLDQVYPKGIILLAHDEGRIEEGMPFFPVELNEWAVKEGVI